MAGPPKIAAAVASYCEEDQHHCIPLTIKRHSGGILHVLALVDTGGEVTVLQSKINNKEATSQICGLGGNPTPALQAKITLTMGNATPFTMVVLIAPVKEYISCIDVLVGQTVETLNGHFCCRTWQVGFAIQSVTVLCGFLKRDPVVLPMSAKVVTAKQYCIPEGRRKLLEPFRHFNK